VPIGKEPGCSGDNGTTEGQLELGIAKDQPHLRDPAKVIVDISKPFVVEDFLPVKPAV